MWQFEGRTSGVEEKTTSEMARGDKKLSLFEKSER